MKKKKETPPALSLEEQTAVVLAIELSEGDKSLDALLVEQPKQKKANVVDVLNRAATHLSLMQICWTFARIDSLVNSARMEASARSRRAFSTRVT